MKQLFEPGSRSSVFRVTLFFFLVLALPVPSSILLQAQGNSTGGDTIQGSIGLSMKTEMMVEVGSDFVPPRVSPSSPSMTYPDSALRARVEGSATLRLLVGADGAVKQLELKESSAPSFAEAASKGLGKFAFTPGTVDGTPTEMWLIVTASFEIQDDWNTVYNEGSGKGEKWALVADVAQPTFDGNELNRNILYPLEALQDEIQGTVTVEVTVDAKGKITKTVVVGEAHPVLAEAALAAVTKTKFKPAQKNGEPVIGSVTIPVVFQLSNEATEPRPAREGTKGDAMVEPSYDAAELRGNVIYPEEAKRLRMTGIVKVRVLVSEEGEIEQILVQESEHQLLAQAAADAVRKTKFTAGSQHGTPTSIWITVPVEFALDGASSTDPGTPRSR